VKSESNLLNCDLIGWSMKERCFDASYSANGYRTLASSLSLPSFQARSVVRGIFIKALLYPQIAEKWKSKTAGAQKE
jgi:hypothetical protein